MLNEHNTRDIAYEMEELLETPVSEQIVKLMTVENRIRFVKQLYLWTIGKVSDEEIRNICKRYLDEAKQNIIKRYEPKNEVDKLYLDQKLNN